MRFLSPRMFLGCALAAAVMAGGEMRRAEGQTDPAKRESAKAPGGPSSAGVVVLDEKDFERVPEGVRGQTLAGPGPVALPVSPATERGEVLRFDPRRNAAQDVRNAVAAAARSGKHVLVEVGGEWCPYCKVLDQFFATNPPVNALRQKNFLFVKVNFSEENQNEEFLRNLPEIRGFPHFFVLNGKGELVRSQRVATLGTSSGYSPERFTAFLKAFGPQP